jgi:hypothetical protein
MLLLLVVQHHQQHVHARLLADTLLVAMGLWQHRRVMSLIWCSSLSDVLLSEGVHRQPTCVSERLAQKDAHRDAYHASQNT